VRCGATGRSRVPARLVLAGEDRRAHTGVEGVEKATRCEGVYVYICSVGMRRSTSYKQVV
jgi:hypothetical protein